MAKLAPQRTDWTTTGYRGRLNKLRVGYDLLLDTPEGKDRRQFMLAIRAWVADHFESGTFSITQTTYRNTVLVERHK